LETWEPSQHLLSSQHLLKYYFRFHVVQVVCFKNVSILNLEIIST
jgi:hypothetical protein